MTDIIVTLNFYLNDNIKNYNFYCIAGAYIRYLMILWGKFEMVINIHDKSKRKNYNDTNGVRKHIYRLIPDVDNKNVILDNCIKINVVKRNINDVDGCNKFNIINDNHFIIDFYDDNVKFIYEVYNSFAKFNLNMANIPLVKNNSNVTIVIENIQYMSNIMTLFELTNLYSHFNFVIKLNLHDDNNRARIFETYNKKTNVIFIDDINEYILSLPDDNRIYMVETVNAINHTDIHHDMQINNFTQSTFIFGSESFGMSNKLMDIISKKTNKQNVIIESKSPIFFERNNMMIQSYSLNLISTVSTILSLFDINFI
jgi:tRNA(Leu) C34 or U34 (ribose-2'-O)-methylase TrmL